MTRLVSSIYRLGEPTELPDPERIHARIWRWCRDLWTERGTIVARPDELPEELRAAMVEWATETYGQRRNGRKAGWR